MSEVAKKRGERKGRVSGETSLSKGSLKKKNEIAGGQKGGGEVKIGPFKRGGGAAVFGRQDVNTEKGILKKGRGDQGLKEGGARGGIPTSGFKNKPYSF